MEQHDRGLQVFHGMRKDRRHGNASTNRVGVGLHRTEQMRVVSYVLAIYLYWLVRHLIRTSQ